MISQERIDQYIKDGHLEVKIIADSISEAGKRITTFQLKYPRFIHAEAKTHRIMSNHTALEFDLGVMADPDMSRNAGSSRAVPILKMIEQVRTNPAMPIHWGKNQSGMQAKEELTGVELENAKKAWLDAAHAAADLAKYMYKQGAHKQIVNRILEPFQNMHTILTATEFDNFFELRIHEDAQPEIYALALTMKQAMEECETQLLKVGEWHLPYLFDYEINHSDLSTNNFKSSSMLGCVPSCFRYETRQQRATPKNNHDSAPISNLKGWIQYRKIYEASL